jgi:hypothetical protein
MATPKKPSQPAGAINTRHTVRFSIQEARELNKAVKKYKVSKSAFIRHAVFYSLRIDLMNASLK